jgi:hypothetical protein
VPGSKKLESWQHLNFFAFFEPASKIEAAAPGAQAPFSSIVVARRAMSDRHVLRELDAPVLRRSAGIPGGMSSILRSAETKELGEDLR